MSCTELLERFWETDRDVSRNEIALFHYLLYRCNTLGWPDTFSVSNEEIVQTLKLRPDHMRDARKALVEAGLLNFQSGTGRGGTSFYSFCEKKGTKWEHLFDEKGDQMGTPFPKRGPNGNTFMVTFDNKGDQMGTPFEKIVKNDHTLKEEKQEKKTFPPAPPIKEKKEKKKNTQKSTTPAPARTHMCENGQFTLFSEEVPPLKKKRVPIEPYLPGSIDDVFAFFEKNAADKLPDWKTEAELFFYHYESLGWVGTSNRKIQDWESRANLWIGDKVLKNGEQERTRAEILPGTIRPDRRTTGVPQERERGQTYAEKRGSNCSEQNDAPKDYSKIF